MTGQWSSYAVRNSSPGDSSSWGVPVEFIESTQTTLSPSAAVVTITVTTTSINQSLAPNAASIAITATTPALNQSIAPSAASVTITVSDATLNQSISPSVAIVAITVTDPTISRGGTILDPAAASVSITVNGASVNQSLAPSSASVSITVNAASISSGGELVPDPAVITITVNDGAITLIEPTWSQCCDPCEVPTTTTSEGPEGEAGPNGTNGTNGVDCFTTVASYLPLAQPVMPAYGSNVTLTVGNSEWIEFGQYVFVESAGYFQVQSIPTSTTVILKNIATATAYAGNAAPGTSIASSSLVSPAGIQGQDHKGFPDLYSGHGSPEGVVAALVGSIYTDLDTADLYLKCLTSGKVGWS